MFYEHKNYSRENWKIPFRGSELLESAIKLRNTYRQREMSARKHLADLMNDPSISQNDRRIGDLKREIEFNGQQYEACQVFALVFERQADREFLLSIGDVVYFNLHAKQ